MPGAIGPSLLTLAQNLLTKSPFSSLEHPLEQHTFDELVGLNDVWQIAQACIQTSMLHIT